MRDLNYLRKEIDSINGKGYKAYKSLEGEYDFNDYILHIDHVQGDPFAAPSRIRVTMKSNINKIPRELFNENHKRIAVQDFITRLFYQNINKYGDRVMGSGKSGMISISKCPQEIIDRTSVVIDENKIEARFEVGFPARGRSVLSRELQKILYDFLPKIVNNSLKYENIDKNKLQRRVNLVCDQEFIRKELKERGLVAFIGNGSILPRESGVSTKPLKSAKKFISPKELEIEMNLPHKGLIKGLGIKKGITLIIGGGYHGKSTLLNALEVGVYNHIEGDGREYVIADNTSMKVRAEDGRSIIKDDISLFINNLPNGKDTKKFISENASGSTSQAANIAEAIESNTNLLLIDEDTSATNFMIRDDVMQSLVSNEEEPITPFIELVRAIYEEKYISTIIVVGSSGEYFDIADTVIQMDNYEPKDVTLKAKELSTGAILNRIKNRDIKVNIDFDRKVLKGSIEKGPKGVKIKTLGIDGLSINKEDINLRSVEQIVDREQVTSIGNMMKWAEDKIINNNLTLIEVADRILEEVKEKGLIQMSGMKGGLGSLALPRKQEIMAAFNRYRKLKIK
ncbi:isopentenyl-diphosphate delta-isomerase [Clostridium baratii]|uniref:ABC-ATPase domain-containing protein n=1 Tax=Clostridium baratii TaxID=1561 RepID=UPI0009A42111|nr:ABC-ATPase domain-containing protein [Clostridium baratii]OPF53041.1 isopentenyl-diphosphate delta-isomerase [Clostridium baratii]OPF53738.1 isopentenyl-diphosphate delta-isomerase [Clostridium baratii]OPF54412.1 isopentenyl-diphosphate delta-isomerase [Clostridium baratii]OPF60884.1 isopentenyl-diphosphate delta-isomerase [Clostridium baratii]